MSETDSQFENSVFREPPLCLHWFILLKFRKELMANWGCNNPLEIVASFSKTLWLCLSFFEYFGKARIPKFTLNWQL